MEHAEALQGKFAEKYYLGELTAGDAEQFELHFFDCTECAEAVDLCHTFVAAARPILAEEARVAVRETPGKKPFWTGFAELWQQRLFALPAVAAMFFGGLLVYQTAFVVRPLQQQVEARAIPDSFQLSSSSRGELPRIVLKAGTPTFLLSADVPPDAVYPEHRYVLTTGGRTIFRIMAPAPGKGLPFTIEVPAKGLGPGRYELTAYGVRSGGTSDDRISTYSFNLETTQ